MNVNYELVRLQGIMADSWIYFTEHYGRAALKEKCDFCTHENQLSFVHILEDNRFACVYCLGKF